MRRPSLLHLALVGVSVATIVGSLRRAVWDELGPGPGFFPLVVGVLLLGLSLRVLVRDSRPQPATEPDVDEDGIRLEEEVVRLGRKSWLVVAALVVGILTMDLIGFRIAVAAIVLFILAVVERMRPPVAVGIAAAISAGSFYLFTDLLGVQLPTGLLGV